MGLFKPDFYRSFAIGFALGAVVVFGSMGINGSGPFTGAIAPAAVAASVE